MKTKLISELSAGPLKFTANKTDTDIIFNLYYEDHQIVSDMNKDTAKMFRTCITDVLKREGESLGLEFKK